jgi:hypothetical protein
MAASANSAEIQFKTTVYITVELGFDKNITAFMGLRINV